MPEDSQLTAVAHVIQLAVAPVFLVSGIAGLLAVLANRLGRIIDRARVLEVVPQSNAAVATELVALSRRAVLINHSITLATSSALLISTVIVFLFLGAFLSLNVVLVVGILFVVAMLALIVGLVTFLREVRLAVHTLHIGTGH